MAKKKYGDDIGKILEGDKESPQAPPPEEYEAVLKETDNYAKWSSGSSKVGPPGKKRTSSPAIDEREVRHRSAGKGKLGIPEREKSNINQFVRELRYVLDPHECQELARKYIEWGAAAQKKLDKHRKDCENRASYPFDHLIAQRYGDPAERANYIAKELRSSY